MWQLQSESATPATSIHSPVPASCRLPRYLKSNPVTRAGSHSLASRRRHAIFGFMKSKSPGALPLAICLIVLGLSGCANPAQTYVTQHPELSAEHRKLFLAGKIANGDTVAGLT